MAQRTDSERVAREVYRKTAALYHEVRPQMNVPNDLWYEVLYGPPTLPASHQPLSIVPEVVFVGVQPGAQAGATYEEPKNDPL